MRDQLHRLGEGIKAGVRALRVLAITLALTSPAKLSRWVSAYRLALYYQLITKLELISNHSAYIKLKQKAERASYALRVLAFTIAIFLLKGYSKARASWFIRKVTALTTQTSQFIHYKVQRTPILTY